MPQVVPFAPRLARKRPDSRTEHALSVLIDDLQVLAISRPCAVEALAAQARLLAAPLRRDRRASDRPTPMTGDDHSHSR